LVVAVFATVIEEGVPGVSVVSDVARLLAEGVTAETVAVLENAAVEPLAFAAVTLQRIGL
jgi:predicted pyridoxine 5'-phosphate oxidase superfamily flavin-nucleotide-binding protein